MDETLKVIPPTIPAKCKDHFARKVEAVPAADIPTLLGQMDAYLKVVRAASKTNKFLNLALVERMATAARQLLAAYREMPEEHRGLVIGAVRYFIDSNDANDDLKDPLGFDDDLAVLNTVIMAIGREDLIVTR